MDQDLIFTKMCKYGEYGICSLCPQEDCPEKKKNINNKFFEKWGEILQYWTGISFSNNEIKKITDYLKQNKESVIKEINEL